MLVKNVTQLTTPIPHEDLIFLVNGHRDQHAYAISRQATVDNIIELLSEAGISYVDLKKILDFGCGCGRVLAGWEHILPEGATLRGVDINPQLVEFCTLNIPFAKVSASAYYPPLKSFDARSVDLVYAASVFTHMTLPATIQWAGEFARIVAPGGVLMMSYHGTYYASIVAQLSADGSRLLEERGFYCHLHSKESDTFEGSNHYATFMSSGFVLSLFKGFDLVRIFPGISRGPNPFASYQDIAIFKRQF
jgi:SAM-dependent methyltransferase